MKSSDCRFTINALGRWIIHKADDFAYAWSGSKWVRVSLFPYGIPLKIQVCNFATLEEAEAYVRTRTAQPGTLAQSNLH
jgi:hypothetical protein